MDFVIGTLVQRLKAANRYESSLIILMADHAWRQDPLIGTENRAEHLCHIPLCIKLPEQLMQRTLDSRFSTADLGSPGCIHGQNLNRNQCCRFFGSTKIHQLLLAGTN